MPIVTSSFSMSQDACESDGRVGGSRMRASLSMAMINLSSWCGTQSSRCSCFPSRGKNGLQFLHRAHEQRHRNRTQQWQVNSDFMFIREVDHSYHGAIEEGALDFEFSCLCTIQSLVETTFFERGASANIESVWHVTSSPAGDSKHWERELTHHPNAPWSAARPSPLYPESQYCSGSASIVQ